MVRRTVRKDYKRIISKLYLIGMSKNNIYTTLKDNGINVKRKEVREYLNNRMYNKTGDTTRYRKRFVSLNKQFKVGMISDLEHSRKHLNKNYLIYVSIDLLKNKKIKYSKALKSFVKKQTHGKDVIEWTS